MTLLYVKRSIDSMGVIGKHSYYFFLDIFIKNDIMNI